jgi:hypothetical protein
MTSPAARRLPAVQPTVKGPQPSQQPPKGVQSQPSQAATTTPKPTASTQPTTGQRLALTAAQAHLIPRQQKANPNGSKISTKVTTPLITLGSKPYNVGTKHHDPKTLKHVSHEAALELEEEERKELEKREEQEKLDSAAKKSTQNAVAAH